MKTYEKPRLNALSLSGNDMLCNSCDIDIIGDNADTNIKAMLEIFGDPSQVLGSGEDCAIKVSIEGYCKFTGANVVINS